MLTRALDAASAYGQSLALKSAGGEDTAAVGDAGGSFGAFLKSALDDVSGTARAAEHQSALAVAGKADLVDVVTAVNGAEMALDTMVTVRDRVISAYQDIMRMPI